MADEPATNQGPQGQQTAPKPPEATPSNQTDELRQGQQSALRQREDAPAVQADDEAARYTKAQFLAAYRSLSFLREHALDAEGVHSVSAGDIGAAFHLRGNPETLSQDELYAAVAEYLDRDVPTGKES